MNTPTSKTNSETYVYLSMLSPLYMAEISPPEVRGSLMALEQFAIVLGAVLGFWTGFFTRGSKCFSPSSCTDRNERIDSQWCCFLAYTTCNSDRAGRVVSDRIIIVTSFPSFACSAWTIY